MPKYENFELVIEWIANPDSYQVRVLRSGAGGDATDKFKLEEIEAPPDIQKEIQINNKQTLPERHVIVSNKSYRPDFTRALPETTAKTVGERLKAAVFKSNIMLEWGKCLKDCKENNAVLRVRLDLTGAPELAALPWEYMMLPGSDNLFMGLDREISLVRYLRTSHDVQLLKIVPPLLRVLVMVSAPQDLAQLNTQTEILKISERLQSLTGKYIEVSVLNEATSQNLENKLKEAKSQNEPFHIFHFIGHGAFDIEAQAGVLFFEDEQKNSFPVTHEDLGRWLKPYRSDLRLILLNACETARLSVKDPYSNVAARIMQIAGIPSSIAMQFRITDEAAIIFAEAFYARIVEGEDLETAVNAGRHAIRDRRGVIANEWATPVFYLIADSSHLLEIRPPEPPEKLEPHYGAIRREISTCKLVFFLGLNVNGIDRPLYKDSWEPKVGAPTVVELYSYLIRKHDIAAPGGTLASVAQQIDNWENAHLPDVFQNIFSPDKKNKKTSRLYDVLAEVAKKVTDMLELETEEEPAALLFVTTTYDTALEEAFIKKGIDRYHIICYGLDGRTSQWLFSHRRYKEGKLIQTVHLTEKVLKNYTGWFDNAPIILKLPGEVGYDLQFAATEDDFFVFTKKKPLDLIPADVLNLLNDSRHIYLGYDLHNWTLRLLWESICENHNHFQRKASYAVAFDGNEDASGSFWRKKGIKFDTVRLEDYVAGLQENVLNQL